MALTKIDDRGLTTPIDLLDNENIRFGTGNDLQLYHDGSQSYITNATSDLRIRSGYVKLQGSNGEDMVIGNQNTSVELYYDNAKKLNTEADGITVTGNIGIGGDAPNYQVHATTSIGVGAHGFNQQLTIENDSIQSLVLGTGYTTLHLNQLGGNVDIANDSSRLRLGTGQDLQIYHDGSDSYIKHNGTGNFYVQTSEAAVEDLFLQAGNDVYIRVQTGETAIKAIGDGGVELYYDGVKKLETTSDGIKVSAASGIGQIQLTRGSVAWDANATSSVAYMGTSTAHNCSLRAHGANQAVIVDGGIRWNDDKKAFFGTGDDLEIWHDGSHTRLNNATGNFNVQTGKFVVTNVANTENILIGTQDGGVELYNDNVKRFYTHASGAYCVGNLGASDELYLPDDGKVVCGGGDDLQIYHNGTNSYIDNNTGILLIDGVEVQIRTNGNEDSVKCHANGNVELYYDATKRFDTSASGITIFGGNGSGRILPGTDGEGYIGESAAKWNAIYATNGTIQTSDRNEKNTIIESDLGLNFVNKLKPVSYKWNKDDGKTHYGLIAQDVKETLYTEGKTDKDFAALNIPTKGSMGLNYSELISPLIKAVQELSAEVEALKAK